MNKQEFAQLVNNNRMILDGATGSNLQKAGMPAGVCVEKWICENPKPLMELQREYVEAGSQILYASTFGANAMKLKEYGLEKEVAELNKKAVQISKEAAQDKALVAGDVSMSGQQLEPLGMVTFEEMVENYKEQMKALEEAGADLLVIETMMSLQETRAAMIAAKEATSLPVMATMSFGEDGRTLYGTHAKTAAVVLESLGAAAVGVNCSAGPDKMIQIVRDMSQVCHVPVIAKPNAGLPKLGASGMAEYDMAVEEFASYVPQLVQAGAAVIGGCCGTSPEYIRAVKEAFAALEPVQKEDNSPKSSEYLTSERNVLEWTQDASIGYIGTATPDEINEEWEDEIYDTMYDSIDECTDEEVSMLCICVDGCEKNRPEIMKQVIKEAVSYTALPMIFESSYPEVLEAALRVYPGRSAVKASEEIRDEAAKIADKYGAFLMD